MRGLFPTALVLIAMTCLGPGFASVARADDAAARAAIDSNVDQALDELYSTVQGSKNAANLAEGMLVFPSIYKAGLVIGAEYGKGALRVKGKSVGYYSDAGASFGLQAGAAKHSTVVMFMTPDALNRFENSSGWDLGADASVTLVKLGANGAVDASSLKQPILAFIFGNQGLMGDLSLGGTKVSKLDLPADTAAGSTTPK